MGRSWVKIKEEEKTPEERKVIIKNTSTGQYLCDENGNIKLFNTPLEAKRYINIHRLANNFEIESCNVKNK